RLTSHRISLTEEASLQSPAAGANINDLDPGMERLLQERAERMPFVHPAWLRTWLSEFGAYCEPLLLASANAGVHGVAPLMRADDRITFIGDSNICDFMDFLVSPEKADETYADLWRQITAEEWEELELWGLMASSPTRAFVKAKAEEAGYKL